ncbi:MAG TPA: hypothetical protein VGL89_05540 [Candidatus Koribacter sp.]|jgi:plastocyanin
MRHWGRVLLVVGALAVGAAGQDVHVTGRVQVLQKKGTPASSAADVVVWLTPLDRAAPTAEQKEYKLTQHNKRFEPHLLIVPLGASVQFPNKDPFFHNVFSVYEGTAFDLGLYESGSSKVVHFNRPGPSYIFCNIHPEMSAVVLVLKTPYFARTPANGEFSIDVPAGEYEMGVWYEKARRDDLKTLSRRVKIDAGEASLGKITLTMAPSPAEGHKNKYGQDYEKGAPYPVP